MSTILFKKDIESFKVWAESEHWCLIEEREFDDKDTVSTYITPNGYHVTVTSDSHNIIQKITPWNGNKSAII